MTETHQISSSRNIDTPTVHFFRLWRFLHTNMALSSLNLHTRHTWNREKCSLSVYFMETICILIATLVWFGLFLNQTGNQNYLLLLLFFLPPRDGTETVTCVWALWGKRVFVSLLPFIFKTPYTIRRQLFFMTLKGRFRQFCLSVSFTTSITLYTNW